MKICMLTTTHKPLDVRIFYKEGRSLSKIYDVFIVAPDVEFNEMLVDNIGIITVKKPESKIFHFLTLWRIFREAFRRDFDVYHCHEPDSLLIGVLIKLLKGDDVRIVYDVHEHWPSEIAYGWLKIKKGFLKRIVESVSHVLELSLVKYTDWVVAVSRSVARRFYHVKPVIILPNVPVNDFILSKNLNNVKKNCDLVQMGGGLQSYHGIYEILNALKMVKKTYPEAKIKFVGVVKENASGMFSELKENIIITGFLPIERMYEEIRKCKIGFAILKSEFYNAYIGLPNKVFDYMACGLAVIGSDYPEIRRVIKAVRCGVLVDPNNVSEIANKIIYLLENPAETKKMGIRGRRFVERVMNWKKMENKLKEIYDDQNFQR